MQVTSNTKYTDFAAFIPFVEQSSIDDLKKAADGKYGSPWGLTIGEFFACCDGDFSCIGIDSKDIESFSVIQYYWLESFKDMCEAFTKTLERLSVPQSADARKASASCIRMTFKESVLVFCREYFGLKSFNEVYNLHIDDYLLAKKDSYNKGIFEKSIADIQTQKYKSK